MKSKILCIMLLVCVLSMYPIETCQAGEIQISARSSRGWFFRDRVKDTTIFWDLESHGGKTNIYVTTFYDWEHRAYDERQKYCYFEDVTKHAYSFKVPHSDDWVLGVKNPNSYDITVTYSNIYTHPPPATQLKTVTETKIRISTRDNPVTITTTEVQHYPVRDTRKEETLENALIGVIMLSAILLIIVPASILRMKKGESEPTPPKPKEKTFPVPPPVPTPPAEERIEKVSVMPKIEYHCHVCDAELINNPKFCEQCGAEVEGQNETGDDKEHENHKR